jgi:hypothetical protein
MNCVDAGIRWLSHKSGPAPTASHKRQREKLALDSAEGIIVVGLADLASPLSAGHVKLRPP